MARPRLEQPARIYRATLCLREGEDDDLIAFLDSVPARGRAAAIIMAMRAGGVSAATEHLDVDDQALAAALDDMMF